MKVRGKFVLNSAVEAAGSNPAAKTIRLSAIMDNDTPENARFAQATPWGEITMHVSNPEAIAELSTPGKFYYVDFIPVE